MNIYRHAGRSFKSVGLCLQHRNCILKACCLHGPNSLLTHCHLTTGIALLKKLGEESGLLPASYFEQENQRNRDTFLEAIGRYYERITHRRGHVEFIYSALSYMEQFGVHKDLEAYKRIMDIFPKGKMIPTNVFQTMFQHYPKQQHCAVDILQKMEDNGVIPDRELEIIMVNAFGNTSFAVNKLRRMAYWMPKFRNLSPFPLPNPVPMDTLELAKLAIQRITLPDLQTQIEVYKASELEDAIDHTWIVSGQSVVQKELLSKLPPGTALYVEGAFRVWLRNMCVHYFILRGETTVRSVETMNKKPDPEEADDISHLKSWILRDPEEIEHEVEAVPTVHEQEDGTILGCCATGSSSRDSLLSWIRFLEKTNPKLADFPVLFTLKSPLGEVVELPQLEENTKNGTEERNLLEKP
ncbi:evolutionarily conserved signaling intermediate in Toll pathway, mitochondrial-like [Artemia franciscana]|uniref:evolutionarily conserved signaling intermediate in Toll pathway, mitochondrial-like n=1 Tax=Artemia franciscana TaxID=6661 RepID=UPI0032DBEFE3